MHYTRKTRLLSLLLVVVMVVGLLPMNVFATESAVAAVATNIHRQLDIR